MQSLSPHGQHYAFKLSLCHYADATRYGCRLCGQLAKYQSMFVHAFTMFSLDPGDYGICIISVIPPLISVKYGPFKVINLSKR